MTRAVGVGKEGGDDPFRAEWRLHQHLRQTLEFAPLLWAG